MDFPTTIEDFMLHGVSESWQYRQKTFTSAEYLRIGSTARIEIRSVGDSEGRQTFEIAIKGAIIRDLPTLAQAIETVREIIKENDGFTRSYLRNKLGKGNV